MTDLRSAFPDLVVLDDRTPRTPAGNVAREAELADQVGRGARPPTYRLWENGRALVVTAREQRLPSFAAAAAESAAEGWPVVLRDSGGTAVPHGPGILQVSLLLPQSRLSAHALEGIYRALCEPVRSALGAWGVDSDYGEVPGSFCDGRFNLVSGARKIAGTSQRWRGGIPPSSRPDGSVVAHMVLFVDADLAAATEAVNRFYRAAGSDLRFDPDAVVTAARRVAESGAAGIAGQGSADALRDRIAGAARAAFAP